MRPPKAHSEETAQQPVKDNNKRRNETRRDK
jgi:hypothetical protein